MKYFILFIQCCFFSSVIGQHIVLDSVSGNEDAITIIRAGADGVEIQSAPSNGVQIWSAGGNGMEIQNASGDGVEIQNAGGDGVDVLNAGDNGIEIDDAGNNGIFVGGAVNWSMDLRGNKSISSSPAGHIAQIYNESTLTSPDVLALKVGTMTNPTFVSNFITFFRGDDTAIGRIEGDGSGGVTYGTTGADFAECLAPVSKENDIKAGDIVGVYSGKVSLRTQNATSVMVITDRPAVLGNQREEESDDERVSFIGQVYVNVRGPVNAGDWIVASGHEDGTGMAIAPSEITLDHQIVGRAWESNLDTGLNKVNTAVGLDISAAKDAIIRKMDQKINQLQDQINELREMITHE